MARFGNGGETIRGVKVKVGDPQFTLLWDTQGRPRSSRRRARRQGDLLARHQGPLQRRARRRQHERLRPREHLLAPAQIRRRQGPRPRPRRRVQVVGPLLSGLRRRQYPHPMEGPDQARRQGRRRPGPPRRQGRPERHRASALPLAESDAGDHDNEVVDGGVGDDAGETVLDRQAAALDLTGPVSLPSPCLFAPTRDSCPLRRRLRPRRLHDAATPRLRNAAGPRLQRFRF